MIKHLFFKCWRHRNTTLSQVIISFLFLLARYQLEFICLIKLLGWSWFTVQGLRDAMTNWAHSYWIKNWKDKIGSWKTSFLLSQMKDFKNWTNQYCQRLCCMHFENTSCSCCRGHGTGPKASLPKTASNRKSSKSWTSRQTRQSQDALSLDEMSTLTICLLNRSMPYHQHTCFMYW